MKISLVYVLLAILSALIAKGDFEAYKGLKYMLDPESINPVEGAAIILATTVIYSTAWIPFIGILAFMRNRISKAFSLVSSIPLLAMVGMVVVVFVVG